MIPDPDPAAPFTFTKPKTQACLAYRPYGRARAPRPIRNRA